MGARTSASLSQDRVVVLVDALCGVDQQRDEVGILRAAPGGADHGAVEPPARREDAGRIDEDELRRARDRDAAHQRARRLHLGRDDRDLGADQRIEQRRFAGIGRADQRDEAAARARGAPVIDSAQPLRRPALTPSRDSMAAAAACSAARFERPDAFGRRETPAAARRRGIPDRGRGRSAPLRYRPASASPRACAHSCNTVFGSRNGCARLRMRACHSRSTRSLGRRIAAIEIDRADQRLADIGEDRRALAAAGIGFRVAELDRGAEIDRRARSPRRFPCAPDRRAGATVRPRRLSGKRGTACRRSPGRARDRREIPAADSCRRGCARP